MKKIIIIVSVGILELGRLNGMTVSTSIQADCFGDFADCMNTAELEYDSSSNVISGAEKKAQEIYVRRVRACVSN